MPTGLLLSTKPIRETFPECLRIAFNYIYNNKGPLGAFIVSAQMTRNTITNLYESDDSETNPEFINFIEETRKRQIKEEKKVDPKTALGNNSGHFLASSGLSNNAN